MQQEEENMEFTWRKSYTQKITIMKQTELRAIADRAPSQQCCWDLKHPPLGQGA